MDTRNIEKNSPQLETLPQNKWHKPFSTLTVKELYSQSLIKTKKMADGSVCYFCIANIDFPENVHPAGSKKVFTVLIEPARNDYLYEISARMESRPASIFIAVPKIKDNQVVYAYWEKEHPADIDKPNPFTAYSLEIEKIEVKSRKISTKVKSKASKN